MSVGTAASSLDGATLPAVVVLEREPAVFLVALYLRGFWLEVRADGPGPTRARYVYGTSWARDLTVGLG